MQVVDRLHWYVQSGDTIVDFCCGSNDFSCLMISKLEQMGKICSFKNYDIFQAKNDFCFEKRDWFSINVKNCPTVLNCHFICLDLLTYIINKWKTGTGSLPHYTFGAALTGRPGTLK
ncbi:protein ENHANCED DOWNY MILDEW 2-like isoform X2 [Neltuma alba]|uniref:protein ENHANCED DOWNY MILDEW 2-like isoform X2 n=1 Tax=Neltuma alba TaxID=207710 RepID=UPI0010A51F9B|nr:protein ENHANCED DOWNY MILDEW 2-like isoform X2 [Prosopis alba]